MGAFGERLHDAMLIAGATPAWLAHKRSVGREAVHAWLASETAACVDGHMLAVLGMDLGVSIRWLALGIGTPVPIGIKKAREHRVNPRPVTRRAPRKRRDEVPRE